MFDLTIQLETESETIYRDVCLKIKEASSIPPLQSVLRYCMKMSEENSASSVFVSEPHSSIVDGKSGCQVRVTSFWIKNNRGKNWVVRNRRKKWKKLQQIQYIASKTQL